MGSLQLCSSQWAYLQIHSTCSKLLLLVLPLPSSRPLPRLTPITTAWPPPSSTTPTPTGPEFPPLIHPPPVSAAVARDPLNPDITPLMSPDLPRVLARDPLTPRLTPHMLVTDSPTAAPLTPPTPCIMLPCTTTATAMDFTIKLLLALCY